MTNRHKKLPALQWYPGDWRKDPGVQAADFETRGIWFECCMLMHESEDRGRLVLNGRPMPDPAIARMLGLGLDDWLESKQVILDYGIGSVDDDGALINRLAELVAAGLVEWYAIEGRPYLQFPGFGRHQKGLRKDREADSRIPGPDAAGAVAINGYDHCPVCDSLPSPKDIIDALRRVARAPTETQEEV